jgi:hypothetical protein
MLGVTRAMRSNIHENSVSQFLDVFRRTEAFWAAEDEGEL